MDVLHDNNALQESNDCIGGLLHLGLNFITFRTLLHLGQLLHLGLQQVLPWYPKRNDPRKDEREVVS